MLPRKEFVCLFDLILYVPSTIFQLYRDESRPSSPVWQDGERRTTFLAEYAFRRVPFRVTLKCVKDSFSRKGLLFAKRSFIFAKRTFIMAKTTYNNYL